MRPDDLDFGGYQPSPQTAAPDLSATTAQAANAVASGSQNSYEVIIENIDLNFDTMWDEDNAIATSMEEIVRNRLLQVGVNPAVL